MLYSIGGAVGGAVVHHNHSQRAVDLGSDAVKSAAHAVGAVAHREYYAYLAFHVAKLAIIRQTKGQIGAKSERTRDE